jgi:hypothetical protein
VRRDRATSTALGNQFGDSTLCVDQKSEPAGILLFGCIVREHQASMG